MEKSYLNFDSFLLLKPWLMAMKQWTTKPAALQVCAQKFINVSSVLLMKLSLIALNYVTHPTKQPFVWWLTYLLESILSLASCKCLIWFPFLIQSSSSKVIFKAVRRLHIWVALQQSKIISENGEFIFSVTIYNLFLRNNILNIPICHPLMNSLIKVINSFSVLEAVSQLLPTQCLQRSGNTIFICPSQYGQCSATMDVHSKTSGVYWLCWLGDSVKKEFPKLSSQLIHLSGLVLLFSVQQALMLI